LKRARVELDAAQAELAKCTASLAACGRFIAQWDADIAKADEAAANNAKANADKISRGEAPELDNGFLAQVKAKAEAARADLLQSQRHLKADEQAAAAAVERAKRRVSDIAEGIIVAAAVADGAQLNRLWTQVWSLYDRLSVFAELRFSRASNLPVNLNDPFREQRANMLVPISLPPNVVTLIQMLSALDHRFSTGKERAASRLTAWRENLVNDPDSVLE
jgi:hypothetical protein